MATVLPRKKITTTVYLEPEQDERLKALSERTRVPVAAYIREGIDLVLHAHQGASPSQLPLFIDAGPKTSSPRPKKKKR